MLQIVVFLYHFVSFGIDFWLIAGYCGFRLLQFVVFFAITLFISLLVQRNRSKEKTPLPKASVVADGCYYCLRCFGTAELSSCDDLHSILVEFVCWNLLCFSWFSFLRLVSRDCLFCFSRVALSFCGKRKAYTESSSAQASSRRYLKMPTVSGLP